MRSLAFAIALVAALGAAGAQTTGFMPLRADSPPLALRAAVTLALRDVPLRSALDAIGREARIAVVFDAGLTGLDKRVTLSATGLSAAEAIARVLDASALEAMVSANGQVVVLPRRTQPKASIVAGQVVDSASGQGVVGARVELLGTRFSVLTDDAGRFTIGRVPPGAYVVRIAQIGFAPVTRSLGIGDGPAPLRIALEHVATPLSAMVVTPGYFGVMQTVTSAPQTLSRQQLEATPQIGEDVFRALSRLPGMAGTDISAKLHLRGAPQDELYVTLDGVELLEPFHLKDFDDAISIVDVKAIGGLELTSGGFSAEYGDHLTGVFTMRSVEPRKDGTHAAAGISLMNARANADGGFAHGRGGWLVSARRGYIDIALRMADANTNFKPRYGDAFAKVQYDLPWGGRIAAHGLYALDQLHFRDSSDGIISSRYSSGYAWLTWDDAFGARLRQRTVLSSTGLTWRRDGIGLDDGIVWTGTDDRRSFHALGARQDWTFDASSWLAVRWGIDARQERATYDYDGWVRRSRPDSSHRRVISHDDSTTASVAPDGSRVGLYASVRGRIAPGVLAEAGLRRDEASHTGDEIVNPRLNLSWEPRSGTTVRAAWGRYSQAQPLFGLQVADGSERFAAAQRATQRVVGLEQALPLGLTTRIEAYERRVSSVWARFANVGGEIEVIPEVAWDRMLVAPSSARARGIELFVARDRGTRTDWSASYAIASAVDVVGGRDVPRAVDQRHTVRADWSVHPTSNSWRLTTAAIWHSGSPATPQRIVLDSLFDRNGNFSYWASWEPGELRSVRLAGYRRVDVRFTRYFDTRHGRLSLFAEVFNLLGTRNQLNVFTNIDTQGRAIRYHSDSGTQLPRFPAIGFAWEF